MVDKVYKKENITNSIITLNEIIDFIEDGQIPFYNFDSYSEKHEEKRQYEMLLWCKQYAKYLSHLTGKRNPYPTHFMITQEARLTRKQLQPYQYIAITMLGHELRDKPHKSVVQELCFESPCLKKYLTSNEGEIKVQRPEENKKTNISKGFSKIFTPFKFISARNKQK